MRSTWDLDTKGHVAEVEVDMVEGTLVQVVGEVDLETINRRKQGQIAASSP